MGKKRLISTLLHLLAGKSSTPLVVYFPSPVLPLIEHASQTHGTFFFLVQGKALSPPDLLVLRLHRSSLFSQGFIQLFSHFFGFFDRKQVATDNKFKQVSASFTFFPPTFLKCFQHDRTLCQFIIHMFFLLYPFIFWFIKEVIQNFKHRVR